MYSFTASPSEYPFKEGALYFGEDAQGNRLGIETKLHAITFGTPRSGKGVGVINTNLRTWPHNALVVDPKGEAASVSWRARENLGQAVHVLDPFRWSKVPDHLRARFNPLDDLDLDSLTIREDILTIADGTVMRSGDAGAAYWDNGGMRIIAALIAYTLEFLPPEEQNLPTVRRILLSGRNGLLGMAQEDMERAGDRKLASMMLAGVAALEAEESKYFISNAIANTDWLDSEQVAKTLSSSSFSMHDIKREKTSVFICLPFEMLDATKHGRFMRLMVRCGIGAMQKPMPDGSELGERCLFILDEFHSLGKISEIAISCGTMPSSGLTLWPFLHNLGQLTELYGHDGAGTFLGASDLHQFFGTKDGDTLKFISERIGVFNIDDLPPEPVMDTTRWDKETAELAALEAKEKYLMWWEPAYSANLGAKMGVNTRRRLNLEEDEQIYRERLDKFKTDASRILGKPRLAPEQIAHLVRLEHGKPTAENQIVFLRGGKPLICKIGRYFEWYEATAGFYALYEFLTGERFEKP